jgi:hypothetical protein
MKSISIALGLALLSFACDTAEDPEPMPQPDGEALQQRFDDNRTTAVQTFTLDASAGGTVTGAQGTRITFAPGAVGLEGVPAEGDVQIELVEIYDRSSMVLTDRATMGIREDGSLEALKSAGQFFINAKQGGADLDVTGQIMVESRGIDPVTVDPEMTLFRAGDDLGDNGNWEIDNKTADGLNPVRAREDQQGGAVRYFYTLDDFGWTNLDRWYSYTGDTTELWVQAPAGYDGSNAAVYLTYDGEPTALASMDIYDDGLGMFSEHYGRIPVGQQVHFILITEIDGQLHYAIQGATIGVDHVEVMAEPTPGTQAELEAAINALP